MLKGIHLTLLVGPVVPVPVPQIVLDALTSVRITTAAGSASGFELVFRVEKKSPLQTIFLLAGGASPPPIIRVILIVTFNGAPHVLMDGVMTNYRYTPGSGVGESSLSIMGSDLTQVMDFVDFSGTPFPAMPAEARVALLIAKYAVFGMIPLVIPSVNIDIPIPTDRIPRQQGTDLAYINRLAAEVGYVFYLTPGPVPLTNVAYWGPQIKIGVPQPALSLDMDMFTNVESLSFNFDNTAKELPVVFVQNQLTRFPIPIPVPDINPLNPPLGIVQPIPNRIRPLNNVANLSFTQALGRALAQASESSDNVTGNGTLNVLQYGHILRARELVGVRGVGLAYDGLYYVKSVTHEIKRGEYKQSFELSRNGLVSITPKVLV
jgi:hypothetical protein